ncbi:MAG: PAS domain S-box protein, partial [Leptolyngbyaceae bacterium]|nr:PAS domain S-box protein [Leptolyngbyaceae bacterium]
NPSLFVYLYDVPRDTNLFVSQSVADCLGYTAAEISDIGQNVLLTLMHPEDLQRFPEHMARLAQSPPGMVVEFEYRLRHPRDEWRWFRSLDQVYVRDESGQVQQLLGSVLDITDRKTAEANLQASENRFEAIANLVPDLLWESAPNEFNNWHNQRWGDYTGYPSEQANGWGWRDFIHPADLANCARYFQEAVETGQPQRYEQRIRRHDGEYRWFMVNLMPIQDENGQVINVYGASTDIHEERIALDVLRQSEERYRTLFESMDEGFVVLEVIMDEAGEWEDLLVLQVNPAFKQQTGIANPEGCRATEIWGIPNPVWIRAFSAVVETGESVRFEQEEATLNRVFEVYAFRLGEAGSHRVGVLFSDVSDRKQTELALQTSEMHFRRVFASNVVGMMFTDFNGLITDANDCFLDIIGHSRADLDAGRINWAQITPPEYVEADQLAIAHLRRCGEIRPFEKEYLCPDGRRVAVLIGVALLSETDGHCVCVVVDISTRKAAEAALKASRDHLQAMLAALPDLVFHLNREGQYLDYYPTASVADIAKITRIVGQTITDVLPSDIAQAHQQRLNQVLLNQTVDISEQQVWFDGELRYEEVRVAPCGADEAMFIIRDISDRKAAEVELQRTNEELARATRLKDEFLANMSHELRTPLNAILGMTEVLQEEVYGIVNGKQREALEIVEHSATHLLSLINDILDVAKITSGQLVLEPHPVSIEKLCLSSLSFVKQQAFKKRIQLKQQIPPRLPAIALDEIRMRQVLLNLLSNAVKFTLEGGSVTLSVTLLTPEEHSSQQHQLRIAVTDTGIGIAPENIAKLFQPFFQIDSALNRQQTGTGLGLALVKQIVELHGGQVELTSTLGEGSCFTIDLPYEVEAGAKFARERAIAPTTVLIDPDESISIAADAPLILLAEDNPANIATLSSYLQAKGYRLVYAENGQEAIDQALAHHPDVIVMDIQMPGVTGLEAIQQIRQQDSIRETLIIALTALVMEGDRERCLVAGADGYLSKPVRLRDLDFTIKALLAERNPE